MERRRTFVDASHQAAIEENGYAVVPVLTSAEAADLRSAYRALRPSGDHGLAIDYVRPDREVMVAVAELTAPIWARVLPGLFVDHVVVMTTFVTKHPGAASEMFLHDDRCFVDERIERAGTLWVPLVDVGPDLDNGGLQVIPGSHALPTGSSGSNTPDLFRPFEAALRTALVTPELRAGEAIFYDTRTLHASRPNLTGEAREAVVCAVVPRGATPVHLVATGRRRRQLHQVDPSFFLHHHPRQIEREMPDAAVVVDSWDEDLELEPQVVADFLGWSELPEAAVVAPGDLGPVPQGGSVREVAWPAGAPIRDRDLVAPAALGDEHGPDIVEVVHLDGRVGWLSAAGARLDPVVRELDLAPRGASSSWALLADPGTRLRLIVGAAAITFDVTESARQAAGLAAGGALHQLEPGTSLELAPGTEGILWNLGPGPLAAQVSW